ncbi:hypothetical protein HHI36_002661 [Cryptolaemus montrouzieri]|uniref:AB hydrolase-1 domain-containing protein n=1 Tax=Cryptolaemus montrouzieri TaxID=559131 RepID=A0ABD2PB67_9CUCU
MGIWCLNLDALAKDRPVYLMDIIGFGRSSRPRFTGSSTENEKKIINSIELWRKYLKLDEIFLLGHSMGGYLATSYTIAHPESVKLLILCDPWGFSDKFEYPPAWIKVLSFLFDVFNFNPLAYLRCLGPIGPLYIRAARDDILKHFRYYLKDNSIMATYIYQCNAHPNSTGEDAFYSMVGGIGWAKNPMIRRVTELKDDIPIKIMYGSNTWMDTSIGNRIKDLKPDTFVDVELVDQSQHHIYADQAETFNEIVNHICESVENKDIL